MKADDLQYQLFQTMETESRRAVERLADRTYRQEATMKAITGMLELSMANMYADAMNQAVEADYEKAVRDYYAKSINMYKTCLAAEESRDRYRAEGLRQNALVKQLLAEQAPLQATIREFERQLTAAEDALLNHRELYDIAVDEALAAVKEQEAMDRYAKQMEEELHPLRMRVREAEAAVQERATVYDNLMRTYDELNADHATVSSLLQLKNTQLETTLQANRLLESRATTVSSGSGSSRRELELEHQLATQRAVVEAQRMDAHNMYTELQQARAEIQALREAQLSAPTPTQHSQPMSRGASTSTTVPSTSSMPPPAGGSSQGEPFPMDTDQGYDPSHDTIPPVLPQAAPIRHLMTRRPGDDRFVEERRQRLNERQALFERQCSSVVDALWPGMEQPPDRMWPPIYVMELESKKKFEQYFEDFPNDEDKPGYKEINPDRWQIREVLHGQPDWRLIFLGRYRTSRDYAAAPRHLRIDPTFCPMPRRYTWPDYQQLLRDNPNALNYPLLPERSQDQPLNETWFLEACEDVEK